MSDETPVDESPPKASSTSASGDKRHLRAVIPLPVKRELSAPHLEHLASSGITAETAELAQLYSEPHPARCKELLRGMAWGTQRGAALVFPAFLPGEAEPYEYRLRPSVLSGKTKKYQQAKGVGSIVYYPPRTRAGGWLRDLDRPLYWTEGEKKALVLDQLGLATIGLTGVFNFHDAELKRTTGTWKLNTRIVDHVSIRGRHHVIVFDGDSRHNDNVMDAAARLAGLLLAEGALSVKFVCPPPGAQKGIDDFFAAFGEDITRRLLSEAEPIEGKAPEEPWKKLGEIKALRDAPVNLALWLPDGYEVRKDGALWKKGDEKHGDVLIARAPILIVRYLDDYYSQESRLELCFQRDARWVVQSFERRAVADSRTMVAELTRFGAPVTSNNASKLVDWFEAFEAINRGRIDHVMCIDKAGWHTVHDRKLFVLGAPIFGSKEDAPPLELDSRGDRKRLFSALHHRGSYRAHLEALNGAWNAEPIAAAVICAALAAPLLQPLGAPNFGVHLPGDSSRGKTSMLKIGASVYGDPNNDQWVASWNTTQVGAELHAATLCDLPLCLDEVGAGDRQQTERMVYMLINGVGKTRGSKDLQSRETPSWRTIVLSTGEHDLVDESAMTGAQVRILSLPIAGFGSLGAPEVDALRDACAAHAGSFGQAWIEALLDVEDWDEYRDVYTQFRKMLRSRARSSLGARSAGFWALLATAETMVSPLGLGQTAGMTMQRLFAEQSLSQRVRPAAARALDAILDWVASEPKAFPELGIGVGGEDKPESTNAHVLHGYRKPCGRILFIPRQLKEFLTRNNFSPSEVLREWARNEWIEGDSSHHTKVARIGSSQPTRFVVLNPPDEEAAC